MDFENLGFKLRLFTRQQSFLDKLKENSEFFLVILHDFQNNVVNTPNAVAKGSFFRSKHAIEEKQLH